MAVPLTRSGIARLGPNGLSIAVRVTPKSSRDAVEGIETRGDATVLKVRVRAAPENGKANAAVAELIASFLDAPRRSADVTSGHTSRNKIVTVSGDGDRLQRLLHDRLGHAPP